MNFDIRVFHVPPYLNYTHQLEHNSSGSLSLLALHRAHHVNLQQIFFHPTSLPSIIMHILNIFLQNFNLLRGSQNFGQINLRDFHKN